MTIKLEGAEMAGYQAIIIGGVREPFIIRQLDSWLDAMREKFKARVHEMFGGRLGPDDYDIHVRVYGRDGVMGKLEPRADQMGHEVALLFTITSAGRGDDRRDRQDLRALRPALPDPGMARADQRHRVPDGALARQSRAGLSASTSTTSSRRTIRWKCSAPNSWRSDAWPSWAISHG